MRPLRGRRGIKYTSRFLVTQPSRDSRTPRIHPPGSTFFVCSASSREKLCEQNTRHARGARVSQRQVPAHSRSRRDAAVALRCAALRYVALRHVASRCVAGSRTFHFRARDSALSPLLDVGMRPANAFIPLLSLSLRTPSRDDGVSRPRRLVG